MPLTTTTRHLQISERSQQLAVRLYVLVVVVATWIIGLLSLAMDRCPPDASSLCAVVGSDGAIGGLLAVSSLLAALKGHHRLKLATATLLALVAGYGLLHNLQAGGYSAGLSWLGGPWRIPTPTALALLLIAICLLLGRSRPRSRALWRLSGLGLMLAGLVMLTAELLGKSSSLLGPHATAASVTALFVAMLGGALALSAHLPPRARLSPDRVSLLALIAGLSLTCTGWFVMSQLHLRAQHHQGEELLAETEARIDQRMRELQLMGQIAERWNTAGTAPPGRQRRQEVAAYLRNTPSLHSIAVLTPERTPAWHQSVARGGRLHDLLRRPEVTAWLALPRQRPGLLLVAGQGRRPSQVLVAQPLTADPPGRLLIGLYDLAPLLRDVADSTATGLVVRLRLDQEFLTSLQPPHVGGTALAASPLLPVAQRAMRLPGGQRLWLESLLLNRAQTITTNLILAIGLAGCLMSFLLAFALGLHRLASLRNRALNNATKRLVDQRHLQNMLASDASLDAILDRACRLLEQRLKGSRVAVLLTGDGPDDWRLAATGSWPQTLTEGLFGLASADGRMPLLETLDRGTIARDDAPGTLHRLAVPRDQLARLGDRSLLAAPLLASSGRRQGYLILLTPRDEALPPQAERHVASLAGLVALARERTEEHQRRVDSEQRYRSLFTQAPDAVFSLDRAGHFGSVNPAFSRLIGREATEVIGRHHLELADEDKREKPAQYFAMALNGEATRFTHTPIAAGAEPQTFDITYLPIVIDESITGVFGIAKDITQQLQDAANLEILSRGVEASRNGILIVDADRPDQPIVYVNPAFETITGYPAAEVLGRNCRFLQGGDTDSQAIAELREALEGDREVHVTLRNYRKDGTPFWNDLYIAPVYHAQHVTHYIGVLTDISERKAYEAQLAYQASHDGLTDLPNRTRLEDCLEQAVQRAKHHGRCLAVLFIDLDGFKPINDSLGHAVGDRMLQVVATRLESVFRSGDTLARFGGDEFVALLPDLLDRTDADRIAQRVLACIAQPYRLDRYELSITASIGIAAGCGTLSSPMQLVQQADMAMYKAKQLGRNHYQWYTETIDHRIIERVTLRNALQEAIEHQQLELHYQPLIETRSGRVYGFEALVRWKHPEQGYISPGAFIPLAEETGQIIPISQWVLKQACRDAGRLNAYADYRVAVNLSPLQFHRPDFLEVLRETLDRTGLAARHLELELTEGILMQDTRGAIEILNTLRGMGLGIAIDDFGTGYSSLSYLKDLPADKLKIDRSFINEVTTSPHDAAIVASTTAMAHRLGLSVVAEGIETPEQVDFLKAHHCDFLQGFFFARPMPLASLLARLDAAPDGRLYLSGQPAESTY